MIKSKQDYLYYLEADRIACGLFSKPTLVQRFKLLIFPNYVLSFQRVLRKLEYYKNCKSGIFNSIIRVMVNRKFDQLSLKLGFSIPPNVFGPGLAIAHYGTIVVNASARVGANCRLHCSVNIGTEAGFSNKAPVIGDNCYIGPGVKMYGNIFLQDGVAIGANAVVNKSFDESNIVLGGIPAKKIGQINTSEILIPATSIIACGLNSDKTLSGLTAKQINERVNIMTLPKS